VTFKGWTVRLNEWSRMLNSVSKKMVNRRLKALGIQVSVTCEVISDQPIAVAYEITKFGHTELEI
jgi:DNA-binding HxlR family transcriptional regulator